MTRLGLLVEAAHRHQQLVEGTLVRLEAHARGLDAVVRDEIRHTFVSECAALEEEMTRATGALRGMQRSASLRLVAWTVGVTTAAAAGLMLTLDRIVPSATQLEALRAQRDQLALQIRQLSAAGGRIDLRRCGEQARLCVRIDKRAPSYGPGADYLILGGY